MTVGTGNGENWMLRLLRLLLRLLRLLLVGGGGAGEHNHKTGCGT